MTDLGKYAPFIIPAYVLTVGFFVWATAATPRDGANGPYLVNYVASWCGPCALEHPTLMALKEQGVRVVGVAYKDTPQAADAFIAKRGDPFAVKLNDAEGRAGIDFGITGVPETYLVGSDGVIIAKVSAPMTNDDARKLMLKAH
jgi:cytochrome c biogenesis protein CcmG/thiol:disulfide interchange protein DsbE